MTPIVGLVLGVGAIVVRRGSAGLEVLLVRRKYDPFRGYWSFPGGHVEPGEPLLEAAARELLEETGIRARPLGVIHIHELVAEGPDGRRHHYVIIDVVFEYEGGEPRASSDAEDAAFVPLVEALKLRLTPGARLVLQKLPEMLQRGCTIEPTRTE
ncbi:NUDIX hydrolase [Hyperthermus butylicus]|uniref:ADP-ribose pyrophosphatase n=1 Tax=Hyperthermus butylicus (strain DSM 5456 / JCM 9403 / PLM1-5) TaxID=415426 RepID=A2BMN7_HYPBU|nr:NUDIX hydrolase [Hyperthermus butylicus]ABM81248.1 putative ADP-ribose pyrophosphatase [Hyperthermus butylicus DSM 5456]